MRAPPDLTLEDFQRAYPRDPVRFREWAWEKYNSMRLQRDIVRALPTAKMPRATGGKRKCPKCAGRAFSDPTVDAQKEATFIVYPCLRCGYDLREEFNPGKRRLKVLGASVKDRALEYLQRPEADSGVGIEEVAKALGAIPATAGEGLCRLVKEGKAVRLEAGRYRRK